jgi:hypothetical protein
MTSDGWKVPINGTVNQLFCPFVTWAMLSGAIIKNVNRKIPNPYKYHDNLFN